MILDEIKEKVDSLWALFYENGLINPLEAVEQVTYLLFIMDLDRNDQKNREKSAIEGTPFESIFPEYFLQGEKKIQGSSLKWSVFRHFQEEKMQDTVQNHLFPFLKTLQNTQKTSYSQYLEDAVFKLSSPFLLAEVVAHLDAIFTQIDEKGDDPLEGDFYEYLLSKIPESGSSGLLRTPSHIATMMAKLMKPTLNDTICDPVCGTSSFLIALWDTLRATEKETDFLQKNNNSAKITDMFHGFDNDRTMLRIGAMNMQTHGAKNPYFHHCDSLSEQNSHRKKYSLILATPPFKGNVKGETISADLLEICKTKRSELLFVALIVKMLKNGGRSAVLVSDGVLFGRSKAHQELRKELVDHQRLEGVISLPSGVFKPYSGVSTGILIFTKTDQGGTDSVWFYDMQGDGFSLDHRRIPVSENDIPDILERFSNRQNELERDRTEKSFLVPKEEIIKNDYDLSIREYKKTVYVEEKFPPIHEILADISDLEEKIAKGMAKLEELQ